MNYVREKMEKKGKIASFTDLLAWQQGHQLVLGVYRAVKKFPDDELFGLGSQMKRSSVSITSNIAEAFGRNGIKEKIQFYYHAHGSLTELKNQLLIARDVEYMSPRIFQALAEQANRTHELLRGLIKSTKGWKVNEKRNS